MEKVFSNAANVSSNTLLPQKPLINIRPQQAAKEIGYSISWLYELIKRGVLPKPHPIYPGSRAVAFYRHELDAIIAGNNPDMERQANEKI
jgi:predicted DNA-binding transcriptional regulator AlpA